MTELNKAQTEAIRGAIIGAIENSQGKSWEKELSKFEEEFKNAKVAGVSIKTLVEALRSYGLKAPRNVVVNYLTKTIGFKVSKRRTKLKKN